MGLRETRVEQLRQSIRQFERFSGRIGVIWAIASSVLAITWATMSLTEGPLGNETIAFAVATLILVGSFSLGFVASRIVIWILRWEVRRLQGKEEASGPGIDSEGVQTKPDQVYETFRTSIETKTSILVWLVPTLAATYGGIAIAYFTIGEGSRESLYASLIAAAILTIVVLPMISSKSR